MAFIDKKDPVVLNIKLTSKGRELLSQGNLKFKYFAIGDSEIDYKYISETNNNPFYSNILRPADKNPKLLSFITKKLSGDSFNALSSITTTPTILQNTVDNVGFFSINTGSTSFITDTDHIKQPDVMIKISGVTGGTLLKIDKAPTYMANVNEPSIGDYILIKWTNPYGINTTGYTVNVNYAVPYLIYKIQDLSGKLSTNNLVVNVDRNLPNFSVLTGGSNSVVAGAVILYNYINFTGDTIYNNYSTDFLNESVLTFLENAQCPTITFPFWNLSIIYTDEIVGVQDDNFKFGNFASKTYAGFVSYIQNQSPVLKKLGVIHYTNSSPSNTYGEELFQNTPVLNIPTIMWHKSNSKKIGIKLSAYGNVKLLTGSTHSLDTSYYDLADDSGNIVGKIFNDLKIFVIEDQELLFALSYKSNRSWTLPNYSVGSNDDIVVGCTPCFINYDYVAYSPSIIGGDDGKIIISNIETIGTKLILDISGETSGQVYLNTISITGTTIIDNLVADTYHVVIHDLNALGCPEKIIVLSAATSNLLYYDLSATRNGLTPTFSIGQNYNPTNITIYGSTIGTLYGVGSVAIVPFGTTYGGVPSGAWQIINTGSNVNFTSLTFTSPYTVYVRDMSGSTLLGVVSKDYVAAASPLNPNYIVSNKQIDGGGTYVTVSNYLKTIVPSSNPVVGTIEFATYAYDGFATEWHTLPVQDILNNVPIKLYLNNTTHYWVAIRERYQTIQMYRYNYDSNV